MSEGSRILLVGATGLVGRAVLAAAGAAPDLSLVALARREVGLPRGGSARLEMVLAPAAQWPRLIALIGPEAIVCALGTTRARSGIEGLARVDHELVLQVAEAGRKVGARRFVGVSSVGADPHSRSAYLAIKGRAEEALRALGFARLDLLRPGLLRARRADEARPLERLGQMVSPLGDLLLHGKLRRLRAIEAAHVARAALQATREADAGIFIHEYDALMRLSRRWPGALAGPLGQSMGG